MNFGYLLHEYQAMGLKLPQRVTLGTSIAHLLIAGKSGSGKSLSLRWYLYQLLKNQESTIYIADYKGGTEYEAFEGSPSYASGLRAFDMVEQFYQFFSFVRNNRIRLKQHYTLVVEEWLGLLTYAETQDKKLRASLMAKVGEILAVGRGLNIGLILCVQRADASLFSNGSREQFQAVIAFGRTSAEHFRMLGFSSELDTNPTGGYKPGQALCLIDGQGDPLEIIVPLISNPVNMNRSIRRCLDRQPTLTDLPLRFSKGGENNAR